MNLIIATLLFLILIYWYQKSHFKYLIFFTSVLLLLPLFSRITYISAFQIGDSDYVLSIYHWLGFLFAVLFLSRFIKSVKLQSVPYGIFVSIFTIIVLIHFLNPLNYSLKTRIWGLRDILGWWGMMAGFYFWLQRMKWEKDEYFRLLSIFALLATAAIIYSLYQVNYGFTELDKRLFTATGFDYESTSLESSITLAGIPRFLHASFLSEKYMIQAYLTGIFFFLYRDFKSKWAVNIFFVILIVGTILNPERTFILIIFGSIFVLILIKIFFFQKTKRRKLLYIFTILICLGILWVVVGKIQDLDTSVSEDITQGRLIELKDIESAQTFTWRLMVWTEMYLPKIYSNPFGYGLGTTGLKDVDISMGNRFPPHSFYLSYIYEIGLLGFLIFIITLFLILKRAIDRVKIGDPFEKQLGTAVICVIICNLIEGTPNLAFYENDFVFVSLMVAFFLAYEGRKMKKLNLPVLNNKE